MNYKDEKWECSLKDYIWTLRVGPRHTLQVECVVPAKHPLPAVYHSYLKCTYRSWNLTTCLLDDNAPTVEIAQIRAIQMLQSMSATTE